MDSCDFYKVCETDEECKHKVLEEIKNGADITAMNNYAVRWTSRYGRTETVKLLIDYGADITANDNYAVRCASEYGHTKTVQLLIDYGADITAKDNWAVRFASRYGYTETVQLLIANGATFQSYIDRLLEFMPNS